MVLPTVMEMVTVDFVCIPSLSVCVINLRPYSLSSITISFSVFTLMPMLLPLVLFYSPMQPVSIITVDLEVIILYSKVISDLSYTMNQLKVHLFVWFAGIMFLD